MGVAVITSTSAGRALALQLHALMHAEAVLFVHHRKAQIAEGDVFGEQRMGADQDVDLACRQPRQCLVAAGAFLASGQAGQAARPPPAA